MDDGRTCRLHRLCGRRRRRLPGRLPELASPPLHRHGGKACFTRHATYADHTVLLSRNDKP